MKEKAVVKETAQMKAEATRRSLLRPSWLLLAGIVIAASIAIGVEVWWSNRPAFREATQSCTALARLVEVAARPEAYRQCMRHRDSSDPNSRTLRLTIERVPVRLLHA